MSITPRLARTTLFLTLLALVAGTSQNLFATNATVGNCFVNNGGTGYATIQSAVTSTPAGGTIYVCPGTYQEQVLITNPVKVEGVQVTGGTAYAAIVAPPKAGMVQNGSDIFGNPVAAQIFVQNTTGVTIEHLTVDGTGNNLAGCGGPTLEGIYFQNSSGTITDNVVRNQFQTDYADYGGCQNGLAINVEALTSSSIVTVSNNSVRAYQKNGITATGAATGSTPNGPNVTINNNYVVGFGATAMNWPISGAAENGIQFGFGASGKITSNMVIDNIWGQDTSSDTGDAASGILVYASNGITVSGNEVGSAQFSIVAITDNSVTNYGSANDTTITSNKIAGTQLFDGIDLCSNSNTVTSNTIYGSTESGIHFDDTCSGGGKNTGASNTATKNTINEACAGFLLGTGTGNSQSSNTFMNVINTTQTGDTCTAPAVLSGKAAAGHRSRRPSPLRPNRR